MSAMSSLACTDATVLAGGEAILAPTSAAFGAGRVTAILGPNGAGKSTLLSILGGQRAPTGGRVSIDGQPLADYTLAALALRRALMPQDSAVAFEFTAQEIVSLGRYPHRSQPAAGEEGLVAKAMALTGVDGLSGRVLNTLSGGEKARVHLARALVQLWHPRPDGAARWLLLDEPTAALDLAHQHSAMRLLRNWAGQGVGVVAVLHDLNLALRYADDVLVLGGPAGLHAGAAREVLQPSLVERVWAMPCQPVTGGDGVVQFLFG
ncbi:heme ABC transporter ATP-binding protein [soil metagenome]